MTKKQANAAAVVPATETSIALRTPEVIAAEIRFIDGQARQYVLQSAITIGEKLIEVKEIVGHGEWGKWLKDNVNYGQSTANNFMRVATEYASSQTLVNLSYSQAVALLSVPAEDREEFAEEVGASEMSTRELQAAIRAREEAEKKLVEEQNHKEEQKAQFDAWAANQAKQNQELEERYKLSTELREQAEKQMEELAAELEKAKAGGDDKAAAKAKTELRNAEKARQEQEKKAAELQKLLDEQKSIAEKEAKELLAKQEEAFKQAAEKEKKSLQDQLKKLEQQLSRSNNEAFLKAKLQLSQLVEMGDTLVKAIAGVKEPEEQTKLKAAAAKVVDQLCSML